MVQTVAAAEEQPPIEKPPSRRARLSSWIPLGVFVIAAGVIALVSKASLFRLYSGDSDETAYVYQARMMAQGHVTLPARVNALFFYPWLFGQHGSRLFSQYQPGWPAVIAVGHLLGNEKIALVIVAIAIVVAVWFLARELEPAAAPYAAAVLLLSPLFIIHSGVYLSYLWTTALLSGAVAGALAGLRTRRRVPFVISGALFGVAQLTRPVDALIVAFVCTVYVVMRLWKDRSAIAFTALWVAIGVMPFVIVTLVYNTHLTGSPLKFPITAVEPLDKFGFGARKLAPSTRPILYTRAKAVKALWDNTAAVPRWIAGGGIGMVLAIGAAVMRRRRSETWLLVAIILAFPAVYFFWWGTELSAVGSRNGLGPHYWVPIFGPIAALGGWTLAQIARWSRTAIVLLAIAIVIGTFTSTPQMFADARRTSRIMQGKVDELAAAKSLQHAVVIMRSDPRPNLHVDYQFLVGNPKLTDPVLYAIDRGPRESELASLFPDRKIYQWVQRVQPNDSILKPSSIIEPVVIRSGPTVTLRYEVTSDDQQPVVVGYVSVNGSVATTRVLDRRSTPGKTHRFNVILVAPKAPAPPAARDTIVVRMKTDGVVQVGAGFGKNGNLAQGDLFEQRYFVAVDPHRLQVQTPGLQFHLFRSPSEVWVKANVGTRLAERG